MSKEDQDQTFVHRSLQDCDSIGEYLEALAQGFKARRLLFCAGKREMMLKPTGLLKFNVKAKRREEEVKVTLRVSWKELGSDREAGRPLVIQSIEVEEDEG